MAADQALASSLSTARENRPRGGRRIQRWVLAVVFFETGHVSTAVGCAVAVAVFVVIGWNLARNSSAPDRRSTGSARPPLRFREASAGTKALTVLGVLLLVPGLWLIRDDQAVLGIPVLMVALVPLLLVRRRVTGAGPGPVGQSYQ